MRYKLRIPNDTVSLIRGLHPELKKKIRAALLEITDDPLSGKPLKDELHGLWSYRIKKIRIINEKNIGGQFAILVLAQ